MRHRQACSHAAAGPEYGPQWCRTMPCLQHNQRPGQQSLPGMSWGHAMVKVEAVYPFISALSLLLCGKNPAYGREKTSLCTTPQVHFGPSCEGLVKHLTGLLGLFSSCPGAIMKATTGFSLNIPLTRNQPQQDGKSLVSHEDQ